MDRSIAAIAAIAHEALRGLDKHVGLDGIRPPWAEIDEEAQATACELVMQVARQPDVDPLGVPDTETRIFGLVVRGALDFNNGEGGLALDELTRLGQHVVDVGYEPEGGASIVDSAIEVIDSLRYGNPRYRADLGITRAEIARRGMAEDAEGTAIDIIDKLGWPGIEHPQGKPATHVLVPVDVVDGLRRLAQPHVADLPAGTLDVLVPHGVVNTAGGTAVAAGGTVTLAGDDAPRPEDG